jgi:hypothetical protein
MAGSKKAKNPFGIISVELFKLISQIVIAQFASVQD